MWAKARAKAAWSSLSPALGGALDLAGSDLGAAFTGSDFTGAVFAGSGLADPPAPPLESSPLMWAKARAKAAWSSLSPALGGAPGLVGAVFPAPALAAAEEAALEAGLGPVVPVGCWVGCCPDCCCFFFLLL